MVMTTSRGVVVFAFLKNYSCYDPIPNRIRIRVPKNSPNIFIYVSFSPSKKRGRSDILPNFCFNLMRQVIVFQSVTCKFYQLFHSLTIHRSVPFHPTGLIIASKVILHEEHVVCPSRRSQLGYANSLRIA